MVQIAGQFINKFKLAGFDKYCLKYSTFEK